jgi:LPS-assembly protein
LAALRGTFAWWTALPMLLALPAAAYAQPGPVAQAETPSLIEFSADHVVYDSDNDVVTATGAVRMNREGN